MAVKVVGSLVDSPVDSQVDSPVCRNGKGHVGNEEGGIA